MADASDMAVHSPPPATPIADGARDGAVAPVDSTTRHTPRLLMERTCCPAPREPAAAGGGRAEERSRCASGPSGGAPEHLVRAPERSAGAPQRSGGAPERSGSAPGRRGGPAHRDRGFCKTCKKRCVFIGCCRHHFSQTRRTGGIPRVPSESRRRSPFGRLCPLTSTCAFEAKVSRQQGSRSTSAVCPAGADASCPAPAEARE